METDPSFFLPSENFSRGLSHVDIPELGPTLRGKVRENWTIKGDDDVYRLMITTDRQWSFVRPVCTIPDKGQISNLISAYWFEKTKLIVPNHLVAVPHPNVLLAKQAKATIPVEVVLRRYLAKGSTPTSVYDNYFTKGRREIYGLSFPDGLEPGQEFPMGTIITPTTKAKNGHDEELTDDEARIIVDHQLGEGIWERVKTAAFAVFEFARVDCLSKGLILADTKFEFGLDSFGNVMLIDEVLTPDCSRYWILEDFEEKRKRGEDPGLDKELLVRWLTQQGFTGNGQIPVIDPSIIDRMSEIYAGAYRRITGIDLPTPSTDREMIRSTSLECLSNVMGSKSKVHL